MKFDWTLHLKKEPRTFIIMLRGLSRMTDKP